MPMDFCLTYNGTVKAFVTKLRNCGPQLKKYGVDTNNISLFFVSSIALLSNWPWKLCFEPTRQYRRKANGVLENTPTVDNSYKWAGGGILSTAPDLVRVANHLANIYMGRLHSRGVITRDTLTTLWHAYPVNSEGVWQPGLGWFLSRYVHILPLALSKVRAAAFGVKTQRKCLFLTSSPSFRFC